VIRCVLFDLDGTLADTAPDLGYALNLLLEEKQRPAISVSDCRPLASAGARGLLQLGFGLRPGDNEYEPLRQRFLHHYRIHLVRETRLFEGMEAVLRQLSLRNMRWGIVTNKPGWLTQPLLAELRFPTSPCCIISGDSASHPKPHPAPMLMACAQSALLPDDCIYVGDAGRDIEAGRSAGMRTIAAAYGYIEAGDDPYTWGADAVIEEPLALIPWLDKQPVRARKD
jgi:N-acetyl-D-muramate 6-phosphate phosphatase